MIACNPLRGCHFSIKTVSDAAIAKINGYLLGKLLHIAKKIEQWCVTEIVTEHTVAKPLVNEG